MVGAWLRALVVAVGWPAVWETMRGGRGDDTVDLDRSASPEVRALELRIRRLKVVVRLAFLLGTVSAVTLLATILIVASITVGVKILVIVTVGWGLLYWIASFVLGWAEGQLRELDPDNLRIPRWLR